MIVSMRPSGSSTSLKPATWFPSRSTRKLKFGYGSGRTMGIAGHLQVGEVAVGVEVVRDAARAAGALVRAPGDANRELPGLVTREQQGRAVEEDPQPAARPEEL